MINVWPMTLRAAGWTPAAAILTSRRAAAELLSSPLGPRRTPHLQSILDTRSIASSSRASGQRFSVCELNKRPNSGPHLTVAKSVRTLHSTANRCASSRAAKPKSDSQTRALPEDYDPEEGVAFRAKDLSQAEVQHIFGPKVDSQLAMRILRILHGRRLSGTLDDAHSYLEPAGLSQSFVATALAWLRTNYEVDEQKAYDLRMEREQAEMQRDLAANAERLGIYKPKKPKGLLDDPRYGRSGLDEIREHYQREQDKRYATQAEEVRINTGTLQKANQRAELARRETSEWIKKYQEKALISKDASPPAQSAWQRLVPSAIVAVLALLFSLYLAKHYHPPSRAARLWPDIPPAAATIFGLIILNSSVLIAWRIPMFWGFMNRYFLSVPGYPFAMSMIGNMFSHQEVVHLLTNMTMLWFVGSRLHDEIGRGNFLAVYFSSGALASFVSLAVYVSRGIFITSSLGASGAVAGIMATYCCYNYDRHVTFIFLPADWQPRLTALTALLALVAVECVGLRRRWSRIDHAAHLGGYATGAAWAVMLSRKKIESDRQETEKRKKKGYVYKVFG